MQHGEAGRVDGASSLSEPDAAAAARARAGGWRASMPRAGDLWGGLAAAAILLPQAMAFGVTLYALAGLDAAAGAYAGLVGTAMLCLASGLAGGTRGLITAPTGPTLVLLGSSVAALAASGLDAGGVALGLAVTIALAGVLELLIGASGGGRLVKYIPF
ncbi:MAG: SulP family inorganic anion transporter, partial [Gammaproteobacteria bacterium]